MKDSKTQLIKGVWNEYNGTLARKSIEVSPVFLDRMMADIFCPGPYINYIIDFASQEFSFIGESMERHLGLSMKEHKLGDFLKLIHPDDFHHVLNFNIEQ